MATAATTTTTTSESTPKLIMCFEPMVISNSTIWQGISPLSSGLPVFLLQLVLVVLTTRALVLLLRPLNQPRVLAEILGGIVLGPSVMGRIEIFGVYIFPARSLLVMETIAHFGLLCFLFLVGVEMDVTMVRQTGRKALAVAAAGMILPFATGAVASFMLQSFAGKNIHQSEFLVFLGLALSVTAFPVLARILAEIKLLNSDIGRLSMSAAIISDTFTWVILALTIAMTQSRGTAWASLWILAWGVAFVLLCFYGARRGMRWLMRRRISEGQSVGDFHVCLMITGMMAAATVTDAIGLHSAFGAFMFGLAVPNKGPLGVALLEKLEDLVTGLLLPLYFANSGLRTNLSTVTEGRTAALLFVVFVIASIGKVAGTVIISLFYLIPLREGLSLGFLMNTRGVVEMIILEIGRDRRVLDDEAFAVIVMTSLVLTSLVTPAVRYLHRPVRRRLGYKRRTLQRSSADAELRVLACVHNTRNVPSILSLLRLSSPTKRSPIFVYALHLIELTGRASSLLIVHNAATSGGSRKHAAAANEHPSDHISHAFQSYEQQATSISVQTLTIISPYATMHEDVCGLAEEKHVVLILLPFHKQQTVDGGMEPIDPSIKALNENMLLGSPCSVGVLVDRGLSSKSRSGRNSYSVAQLFFGGPDDREALAYTARMAENTCVNLTVVRFVHGEAAASAARSAEGLQDEQLDNSFLTEFRLRKVGEELATYSENAVNNAEEMMEVIRTIDSGRYDLFVVGRRQCEAALELMAGLADWTECPELGTLGDFLASADSATTTASVLVVQQYLGEPVGGCGPSMTEEELERGLRHHLNKGDHRTADGNGAAAQPLNAVHWY
ncbi:cation/H(+) antiporter 15-like [Zingiber officinale]|nr:cation/H(+) antiporter 15-like [Zingiber officinale]